MLPLWVNWKNNTSVPRCLLENYGLTLPYWTILALNNVKIFICSLITFLWLILCDWTKMTFSLLVFSLYFIYASSGILENEIPTLVVHGTSLCPVMKKLKHVYFKPLWRFVEDHHFRELPPTFLDRFFLFRLIYLSNLFFT